MSKRDWRETDEDVENVEAWVEIVYDLLDLVPEDHRAEVLAACSKKEEADREERERTGPGFSVMKLDENWRDGPGVRHWNAIERARYDRGSQVDRGGLHVRGDQLGVLARETLAELPIDVANGCVHIGVRG